MVDPAAQQDGRHVEAIICGVVRSAVRDTGAAGVMVMETGRREGRLLHDWLTRTIGNVTRVISGPDANAEAAGDAQRAEEMRRAEARLTARENRLLLAHPACKTVLLLAASAPPERLLPFGDLYATDLMGLAGGVTLPDDVNALADAAGGVERLDAVLRAWLEERRSPVDALEALPYPVRDTVAERLRLNRAVRRWPRCVPKIGTRTLWIDMFE